MKLFDIIFTIWAVLSIVGLFGLYILTLESM
jgi:hypothetical protein